MRDGGTLSFLLGDHLGSQAITADGNGAKTAELLYKAWGENRYTNGATPTSYHFTGQREESTIGLYYYGARWYDASLGRFAQADTIVPQAGNPQNFNRYSYTLNNPVRYNDPTGHDVACGGQDASQCGNAPIYPWIIDWIWWQMINNAESAVTQEMLALNGQCFACAWASVPNWAPAGDDRVGSSIADSVISLQAMVLWATKVAPDAEWDFKPVIQAMGRPSGESIYQTIDDWQYNYDTWANVHYGYVGMAAGFSSDTLLDGAGFAQYLHNTVRRLPVPTDPAVPGWRAHDYAPDRKAIEVGIDLYASKGLTVSRQDLVNALNAKPGLTRRPAQ